MPYRILLINPWVYDFAAFNLWARPLGLLKVAEFLGQYDIDLRLIDCLEGFKPARYNTGKYPKTPVEKPSILKDVPREYYRYGIDLESFRDMVKEARPFDAVFITSVMTYWYQGIIEAVGIVREISGDPVIVLGGIYATLFPEHAERVIQPGYVHKGAVENDVIDQLVLKGHKKVRNTVPYYKLGLYDNIPFAPLLTSLGCPFSCSYCASGFLNKKFLQRPPYEVLKEVQDLHRMGVTDFAFYDDALLVNSDQHLKPLLRMVSESGLKIRFHCPNGIHAKFIDEEIAHLMNITGFKTIRISLETINEKRQRDTGGKLILSEFKRAVNCLKKYGFTKKEIGVYLMYGLYDQPLSEVVDGIEFLMSLNVRVKLTEFSPIPGTDSFNELVSNGVISKEIDPLLTNNTVFSLLFTGYDRGKIKKLKQLVRKYNRE